MSRFSPLHTLPGPVRGALWMTLAAISMTTMAVLVRHLAAEIHPIEIGFFRMLLGIGFLVPLMVREGPRALHSSSHRFFFGRSILTVIFLMTFFPGVALMEIADAQALTFTEPLFGAVLAIMFLGEPVRAPRIAAVLVGFAGALIILRPGFEVIGTGAVLMLIAALASAFGNTINKFTTRTDSPNTIVFYHAIYSTPLIFIAALFVWTWPTAEQFLWLLAIAGLGTVNQQAFSRAFAAADASMVLPFHFLRLPFGAALGYLVFAELPDIWVWIGAAVIFAATLVLARREAGGSGADQGNTKATRA